MGKFNNEERGGGSSRGGFGGDRGGRGGFRGRGGAGESRGGFQRGPPRGRGAPKVFVQQHRLPGVYVARGAQECLVTKNLVPGESVYNEKRISVEVNSEKV